MNTEITERITQLRKEMAHEKVDAYFVPGTDPHQSEYVPECWLRRNWISGFTGSAGDVLVTADFAGLWTDSRYFLQADNELVKKTFTLMKTGLPDSVSIPEYLKQNLKNKTVGIDPQVVSIQWIKENQAIFEQKGISIKSLAENLVDRLWKDRPIPSLAPIKPLAEEFTGESHSAKLHRIREVLKTESVSAFVVTTLDSIAWAFNIRGTDIPFNPVIISYALITLEDAYLYIQSEKVSPELEAHLGTLVKIKKYNEIASDLKNLKKQRVLIDPKTTSCWIRDCLSESILHEVRSPIVLFKAIKNKVEQTGMKQAHFYDGIALCKFLSWLEKAVQDKSLTEISAAEKLLAFRKNHPHFQGPSFETISGYKEHGAIVHYRATPESNSTLTPDGVYLLDSGGQYLEGTTDITRTITLGNPTTQQKEHFTRVLKGHIALDSVIFPVGTSGAQLDVLARKSLWSAFLDYGHGTGHGVGCYLNVHEGPQSISSRGHEPLKAGMIVSNEPGYYLSGEYGIRIENLVLVQQEAEGFLSFEAITLCPMDKKLMDVSLMTKNEISWVNNYHAQVYEMLSEEMNKKELKWLTEATEPLE
ncbi:MAG: aminopeptidase P family protein [Planctomycetota bacterium]